VDLNNNESQGDKPPEILFFLAVCLRLVAVLILVYGAIKATDRIESSFMESALIFISHALMFVSYFFYAHSAIIQSGKLIGGKGKINYRDNESRPQIVNLLATIALMTVLLVAARVMF
jgi:hypothetical protein